VTAEMTAAPVVLSAVPTLFDADGEVDPGANQALYKLVAGLVTPTTGTVTLMGRQVSGPQKDIGYVFQRAALLDWRGARRNILLQGEMRHMDRAQAARRADELIALTGLRGFENALPYELSGGMQQRVALCRALLHEPPVLLMDEPFGALDAQTREVMQEELLRIWEQDKKTVVFVTHSISESIFLADRIVVMATQPGTIKEIVDVALPHPRERSSAEFVALEREIKRLVREEVAKLGVTG